MMNDENKKIEDLEKKVKVLLQQVQKLNMKVEFLERENKRRRSEINQQKK